jgi:hypothetical protein
MHLHLLPALFSRSTNPIDQKTVASRQTGLVERMAAFGKARAFAEEATNGSNNAMLIDRFWKQLFRKLCFDLFFCLKQGRESS